MNYSGCSNWLDNTIFLYVITHHRQNLIQSRYFQRLLFALRRQYNGRFYKRTIFLVIRGDHAVNY